MKGYIIRYEGDIVSVTDNPKKWLEENNKQREADGSEPETLDTFHIEEIDMDIYGIIMKTLSKDEVKIQDYLEGESDYHRKKKKEDDMIQEMEEEE